LINLEKEIRRKSVFFKKISQRKLSICNRNS